MAEVVHRNIESNGIHVHIAEAGRGPLVILLHGFPEGWYSWRHQLQALAQAGYHAVAPDQRGYGQTDRPTAVEAYSMLHLIGDVIGLVGALGEESVVVVGHDWGAPVAWNAALFRPDVIRGVVGLSVPYRPRGSRRPLDVYRDALGEGFYQIYFQKPGVAERELEGDVRRTMHVALAGASGEAPRISDMMVGERGFLASLELPERMPQWLNEQDLDHWTAEFGRTGFAGGLNWYRNIDSNWELMAPWQGAKVTPPALYVVGDRDVVYNFPGLRQASTDLHKVVPNLTRAIVLEGCGHWTQQERPAEVNNALLEFLEGLQRR